MAQVINAGMSSPGDLKTLGVKAGATDAKTGQPLSNLQQQRILVDQLLRATRRSTDKYITAKFTATGDSKTAVLGNTLGLSSDASTSGIAETYQNSGSNTLTAFKNFINSMPFRYVGMKLEVSDQAIFNQTFTELINDIDFNTTNPYNNYVDQGQNIYSQAPTVRLLNTAGAFNGCWGLKLASLNDAQWIKYSFNCVEIERSW